MKLHVVVFIEVGILKSSHGSRLIARKCLGAYFEVEIRNPRLWGNILRFHKPSSSGLEGWGIAYMQLITWKRVCARDNNKSLVQLQHSVRLVLLHFDNW